MKQGWKRSVPVVKDEMRWADDGETALWNGVLRREPGVFETIILTQSRCVFEHSKVKTSVSLHTKKHLETSSGERRGAASLETPHLLSSRWRSNPTSQKNSLAFVWKGELSSSTLFNHGSEKTNVTGVEMGTEVELRRITFKQNSFSIMETRHVIVSPFDQSLEFLLSLMSLKSAKFRCSTQMWGFKKKKNTHTSLELETQTFQTSQVSVL
jgi:hypothetical protein